MSVSVMPRHLSPKVRLASASSSQLSTRTESSPVLVRTTSPVARSQSPSDTRSSSAKPCVQLAPANSWTEPVHSERVKNATLPISRRSMALPPTVATSPLPCPAGRAEYLSCRAPALAVTSTRYGTLAMVSAVAVVDGPQAIKGQPGLVVVDDVRRSQHPRRKPPGRNDGGPAAHFGLQPGANAFHQGAITKKNARLELLYCVFSEDALRRRDVYARQHGGTLAQRVERDLEPREKHPPYVLPLFSHDLEVRGCAQVDNDSWASIELERCHGVGDPVGADLVRVVDQQRHARAYARAEK